MIRFELRPRMQHTLPFLPTVPTFAVRETDVSRHNGGTASAPLKPLRDDSAPPRKRVELHDAKTVHSSDSKYDYIFAHLLIFVK